MTAFINPIVRGWVAARVQEIRRLPLNLGKTASAVGREVDRACCTRSGARRARATRWPAALIDRSAQRCRGPRLEVRIEMPAGGNRREMYHSCHSRLI